MLSWLRKNIFEQETPGTYKEHNPHKIAKKLLLLGLINGILAALLFIYYAFIFERSVEYTNDTTRRISLPVGVKVFMYIEIDFNQANLKYIKSINYAQIKGETTELELDKLEPFGFKDDKPIYPAGALPNSFFQDVIEVEGQEIKQENITFNSDLRRVGVTSYNPNEIEIPPSWTKRTNAGSKPLNFTGAEGLPILNERFINWIDPTMFYPTKKLWGTVNATKADNSLIIESESEYDKQIIFTSGSFFGFRNFYIPVTFLIISILSVGIALMLIWFP
ncbi:CDC50 [Enterospora canceri]|uniref:CDC50 n=1 Tax=Enterospora canceri TaxID=1081671 RepID=A0A1Y1S6U1_9MICR|nr:CDC50 [Enterospora canceri]